MKAPVGMSCRTMRWSWTQKANCMTMTYEAMYF